MFSVFLQHLFQNAGKDCKRGICLQDELIYAVIIPTCRWEVAGDKSHVKSRASVKCVEKNEMWNVFHLFHLLLL